MRGKYIVAHNRDRDFYQLASAIAEVNALECLVTDYYVGSQPFSLSRLAHRSSHMISPERVRALPSTVALQALRGPIDKLGFDTIHAVNRRIGREVRAQARRCPGVDLLLYSTYAREAFEDPALAEREKNLFMFHPHPTLINEILAPDVSEWGIGVSGLKEETSIAHRIAVLDAELSQADRVLCASALTKRSVVRAGVPEERVHITPYGIARPTPVYQDTRSIDGPLKFLFVGQAIHRKGVHHLLAAWRRERPGDAELTMICSRSQDGLLDDLPPGVTVKSGLSSIELWTEYCRAHCFVLPSLVEGFGLVLLEALSAGCYTIFSDNTGFADLGIPESVGLQFRSGDTEALGSTLTKVGELFSGGSVDHANIQEMSALFSASGFRERVRKCLAA
ncbi:glycosyltransferase family 4 protein [Salipiger manganoxidans]|uniref:glycosyltransferase family 4 protein n=1 Tax=Salipiger marinus TaxID=555512 RepID=UPI001E57BF46|nr:glycosyltransferase family 4 protein [Salipiger manganoxidans]MCD1620941.1 glycosyltransferase family 4 protein [Salipiger manganoxidans]